MSVSAPVTKAMLELQQREFSKSIGLRNDLDHILYQESKKSLTAHYIDRLNTVGYEEFNRMMARQGWRIDYVLEIHRLAAKKKLDNSTSLM